MRYLDKRVERICDELYRLRIVQRMEWTERGRVRATLEIERKASRSATSRAKHIRTRAGIRHALRAAAKSGSMFPRGTTASAC